MSKDNRKIGPRDTGVFQELSKQMKLILRLLADRRVNPMIKLIPVASLIYLVVPTDLMPLLPFDDALIVWLSTVLFVELCPQDVVDEHRKALEGVVQGKWTEPVPPPGEIIDGEFTEKDQPDKK